MHGDAGSTSDDSGPLIGILVVAYNAERTLEATLDRIPRDFRPRIAEIIVADDASGDDTAAAGVRWRTSNPDLATTVVRHLENRGYGGNQKAGYRLAIDRGLDIVVLLHGDGQYAPEVLPALVAPIVEGRADAVFGSRLLEPGAARRGGMPLYKLVGNKVLTRIENGLLGTDLSEWHSGDRAYRVSALAAVDFESNSDGFDFDTEIILQLRAASKRIAEVPIPTYYGDEICHVDGIKYARDVVRDVVEYRASKAGFGTSRWIANPPEYGLKEEADSSHDVICEWLRQGPGLKVLDVGCSAGHLAAKLRALGHYVVGVDREELAGVRDRVDDFVRADLDDGVPDFTGGGFDVVVAADVIEHVREPVRLLQQLGATVGPAGRLLVSTPNFGHWYPRLRALTGTFDYDRRGILDATHVRFFSRRGFLRTVREARLAVEQLAYTGLPLAAVGAGTGKLTGAVRAVDRALVRARPTLFGYQFVAVLRPRNLTSDITA
jgi:glycosyltransferase involved in cell wall biosynthesis